MDDYLEKPLNTDEVIKITNREFGKQSSKPKNY